MDALHAIKTAQREFGKLANLPISSVTGVSHRDDEWVVSLEAVERKAVPDTMDILGFYDVRLDASGSVTGFERKRVRRRGEVGED